MNREQELLRLLDDPAIPVQWNTTGQWKYYPVASGVTQIPVTHGNLKKSWYNIPYHQLMPSYQNSHERPMNYHTKNFAPPKTVKNDLTDDFKYFVTSDEKGQMNCILKQLNDSMKMLDKLVSQRQKAFKGVFYKSDYQIEKYILNSSVQVIPSIDLLVTYACNELQQANVFYKNILQLCKQHEIDFEFSNDLNDMEAIMIDLKQNNELLKEFHLNKTIRYHSEFYSSIADLIEQLNTEFRATAVNYWSATTIVAPAIRAMRTMY